MRELDLASGLLGCSCLGENWHSLDVSGTLGADGVAIYIAASLGIGHGQLELAETAGIGQPQRGASFLACAVQVQVQMQPRRAYVRDVHRTGTPKVTPVVLCWRITLLGKRFSVVSWVLLRDTVHQ